MFLFITSSELDFYLNSFFFFFKDSIGILCDSDVIYEKFEGDFLTFKLLQFINSSVIFGKLLSEILKETSKISIYSPNVNQLDNSLYKKRASAEQNAFQGTTTSFLRQRA